MPYAYFVETSLACASDYTALHWSQTESSKWSLECLSRNLGHPLKLKLYAPV